MIEGINMQNKKCINILKNKNLFHIIFISSCTMHTDIHMFPSAIALNIYLLDHDNFVALAIALN